MMQQQTAGPRGRESEGSGLFVFGMIFGALTGAAVAMWKAVRSGAETRRLIVDAGAAACNRVQQAVLDARAQVVQVGASLRDRAVSALVGARDRIVQTQAEVRHRAQETVAGARDRVSFQAHRLRRQITGERMEDAVAEGKAIARQRQSDLARGRG